MTYRAVSNGTVVLVAFAGTVLAACTVGPNFRPPHRPSGTYMTGQIVGKTFSGSGPKLRIGAAIAADWYHLLRSDNLDQLVTEALRQNPDLVAARASITEAKEQLREVEGDRYPSIEGRAIADRAHLNSGALGLPLPTGATSNNLLAGLLELSYHLDLFGQLNRELELRAAAVEYARDQALATYISLVNQVVVAAFDVAATQSLITATRHLVSIERRQLRLRQIQEQVGTVGQIATLAAKAQLESTEATLPALLQKRTAARAVLSMLVGKAPSNFRAPQLRLNDFRLPTSLPVSVPSQLIRQRPDILAAEQQLRAASAEIGIVEAARLPAFSLSADYGSISNRGGTFFSPSNALWALGGSIVAPIFEGGRLLAQKNRAEAAYLQAKAQYRATVLRAFSQVATALRALRNDSAVLTARNAALHTARRALTLSSRKFSAGTTDALALLLTRRQYRKEVLLQITAQKKCFIDVASLMYALGGGWWNASTDPTPPLDIERTEKVDGPTHG